MKYLLIVVVSMTLFSLGCDDDGGQSIQDIVKNDCEDPIIDSCQGTTMVDCSTLERSGPIVFKDDASGGVVFCECMPRTECTATLTAARCPPDWTCIK